VSQTPQESAAPGQLVPAVAGLPPDPGQQAAYRISPDDLLKIEVFGVEELSSQERVSEDGKIVMPLIGGVQVGGLTPKEAEQRIAGVLGQSYLQDPQVNIFVSEYAGQDVTVGGSVKSPGVYPIKGRTTLSQAIAMAGGITPRSDDEEVVVFRGQGTPSAKAYVVNLEKIHAGSLADPVLVGDDRVFVPESGARVFWDELKGFIRIPAWSW